MVVALITLDELALARFSAADEVQTFELADQVKAGSLLFRHPADAMLHDHACDGQGRPFGNEAWRGAARSASSATAWTRSSTISPPAI
jgi:hypothetical protein